MIAFTKCPQCHRPFVKEIAREGRIGTPVGPCHRCRGAAMTWMIGETNEHLLLSGFEGREMRINFRVSDLMYDLDNTRKVLEDLLEERGIPKKVYAVHWSSTLQFGTNGAETLCVCLTLDRAKRFVMNRISGNDSSSVEWTEHNAHGRSWTMGNHQITEEDLVL